MRMPNFIPLFCLACAVLLAVFLFAESRQDPSLRIAALVAGTGLVNTLAAIASTMLTGKDLSHPVSDLPPGSKVNSAQQTSVTIPSEPESPKV